MMGDNAYGQLGLGTQELASVSYPTLVSTLSTHRVTDVACGEKHTLVITDQPRLFGFGSNDKG